MNQEYWKLFWTTGMPEAWLMSRDMGAVSPSGVDQRTVPGLSSPSAVPRGTVPGNPNNLY